MIDKKDNGLYLHDTILIDRRVWSALEEFYKARDAFDDANGVPSPDRCLPDDIVQCIEIAAASVRHSTFNLLFEEV